MPFFKTVLLGLVFSPVAVEAQSVSRDSSARPDSANTAHELNVVSVRGKTADDRGYAVRRISSATKTDLPLRDVPQAVTVLTRSLLADQSVQSMSEIARFIPGVTFGQGEGHRDAPTIRGNSSTADFFLDGVRDDAQYYRDLYNVERIEALKGSNAMVFGRGGGGGVINRVSKLADWGANRSVLVEGGSFDHKRTTLDFGDGFNSHFAARVTAMAEHSGNFRNSSSLSRRGINPTATILSHGNLIRLGYERFVDNRTIDRGIPSFQGRPSTAPLDRFFGDPDMSRASLSAHNASILVERETSFGLTLRNRTHLSSYDKLYQNVFPAGVTANSTEVNLNGYRSLHDRSSIFNQTDIVFVSRPGFLQHTLVAGSEFGRQTTTNYRETGFFGGASTSLRVPFGSPSVKSGVVFRQNASDPDNDVRASVAAFYVQDQIRLGQHLQAIAGVRQDFFEINFQNNRNAELLSRHDRMISPRAGLIFKPTELMSLYAAVGITNLPSAGDQFSSLSATTETLKPERFINRELGFKWDVLPDLSLSSALYSLDRTNTSAPDPNNPGRSLQTGRQESFGFEANITGNLTGDWQLIAGFANQSAEITNRTSASPAGATVPLVPGKSASLWTRYDITPALGFGVGAVAQTKMFAAIDNTVTLPGFARADAALFLTAARNIRAQINVENLFNTRYFANSHGNNNIMPGAPRTVRISLSVF